MFIQRSKPSGVQVSLNAEKARNAEVQEQIRPFKGYSHILVQSHEHQNKYSLCCYKTVGFHEGNDPEVGSSKVHRVTLETCSCS